MNGCYADPGQVFGQGERLRWCGKILRFVLLNTNKLAGRCI